MYNVQYDYSTEIQTSTSSNSECMIFLTMPEEVGVCEFYGTRSVQVIPEEPE